MAGSACGTVSPSGAILQRMKIEETALVARSTVPVETTVGSEIVLMSLQTGECYGLGDTGSEVWRKMRQPVLVSTLLSELREDYAAPVGVIEQDVKELLEDMLKRGLIELRS
jgi:hypothetical protein